MLTAGITNIATTPGFRQNNISWDYGIPLQFFTSDYTDWVIVKTSGNETATIVGEKLKLDLPVYEDSRIRCNFGYDLPTGDIIQTVDLGSYYGVSSVYKPTFRLEMLSPSETTDAVYIEFFQTSAGKYRVFCRFKVNSSWTDGPTTDLDNKPEKLRLQREGNYLRAWYYVDDAWTEMDSIDSSGHCVNIVESYIRMSDNNYFGGYIYVDNYTIQSEAYNYCRDDFQSIDKWNPDISGAGSLTLDNEKIKLTILDSDNYTQAEYMYPVGLNDSSTEISLSEYSANDASAGPFSGFYLASSMDKDYLMIEYYEDTGSPSYHVRVNYAIDDSVTSGSFIDLDSRPTKFRIERSGSYLRGYYYDETSWTLINNIDFGSNSNNLYLIKLICNDNSTNGGYIEFDDLHSVSGSNTSNIYFKKGKAPNCYFRSLDDWTTTTNNVGEVSSIIGEELSLSIPDGVNGQINCIYDFPIQDEDFEMSIDLANYSVVDSTGMEIYIQIDSDDSKDTAFIKFYSVDSSSTITSNLKVNEINYVVSDSTSEIEIPSKFKIKRSGTTISTYYYSSLWILIDSIDFGSRVSNLQEISIIAKDYLFNGGSANFENLIITPSVKDSGTKISGVVDLIYDHTSLDGGSVYCYEITPQEAGVEGDVSEETYGVPYSGDVSLDSTSTVETTVSSSLAIYKLLSSTISITSSISGGLSLDLVASCDISTNVSGLILTTPEIPINVQVQITGAFKVLVTWDLVDDATSCNLYWDTTSGSYYNKISGILGTSYELTLDYGHSYYFVVTAENIVGESDFSVEVSVLLSRFSEFKYSPLPSDLSSILSGLISSEGDPISYEAITSRPSSRSDRKSRLDDLATYFSESLPLHFLYNNPNTVEELLTSISPDLKDSIDNLFDTDEGDVALSNLLRTLDDWIQDDSNVGPDAPSIEIVLRGLGSSEQQALLDLIEFFKPYRSRLVFIGSIFSIDNTLTESTILDDSFNQYFDAELTFGYDYITNGQLPCYNPRSGETIPPDSTSEHIIQVEYYEIVDEEDEMYNYHNYDTTTGHYESWEFFSDSTAEIETFICADGFSDWDEPDTYFDTPFGNDIVTISVVETP